MWLLECLDERTKKVSRFYLLGGNSYSLGRKGAQLQLTEDDPSVSRHHATLIIMTVPSTEMDGSELVKALRAKQSQTRGATATAYGGRGFGVLGANDEEDAEANGGPPPYPVPEVILLDTSKHGCYMNNQRVNTTTRKATVTRTDTLRFGAHITGRMTYYPVVATLSPTLSDNDVRNAVRILSKFGCFINNPKKSDKLPADAYAVDQLLTPQQRKVEQALKDAYERKMQRLRDRAAITGGNGGGGSSSNDLAAIGSQSFASGVFSSEVNQLLGIGTPTTRRRRNLSFAGGSNFPDDETATLDGFDRYNSIGGGSAGGGDYRHGTDELDIYGFEGQRNEVRARPIEDVSNHISPADATALRITPMMFVYVTNELEVGEPTAMASMLYNYRPVDNNYLYTLYESIFGYPLLGPSRWPEPRAFDHPSFADCTYHKSPLFHIDHQHFHTYTTTAAFRMCHFGFLQDNLFPRYDVVVTKGGGRATQIDPSKVIERLSNGKLYCNTSSVGDSIFGGGDGVGGGNNASFANSGDLASTASFAGMSGAFDTMSMRSGATGFGGASAIFSRSGRRKSRSRRTKKIPMCLKLMGIVQEDTDAHGANLRIVLSSSVFQYLAKELKAKHNDNTVPAYQQELSNLSGGAADGLVNDGGRNGYMDDDGANSDRGSTMSSAAGGGPLPNVDPEVIDAAIHLFDSGYFLVHEDNIHAALYTHDTTAQILPNSPGVLARCEIVDKTEETDSDATVGADSDEEEEGGGYPNAPTPLRPVWGGGGPVTHDQLVRDPILHQLHYAHMHRAPEPMAAQQVPVAAIKTRVENGFAAHIRQPIASVSAARSRGGRGSPQRRW